MLVDFSEIPGSSKLFIDFLNDFDKVKKYFKVNFRDEDSYGPVFKSIAARNNADRSQLVDILNDQYKGFSPSSKTKQNIESLHDDKTIAVFTGQQLGLLGGPLYTIYKVFTAVKLCERLNKNFTDFNFVPVFWMAGDDHDFEEISTINAISKENELEKIIYNDGHEATFNRGSVGDLLLNESVGEFKSTIHDKIRETEFSKELFTMIDNVLGENISIKDSFFSLLYQIFDDTGLIIFNPQDPEVKKLLIPIFKKELIDYKEHTKEVLLKSADLDENYHAQVKIKPINLFMLDDTGRYLIEPVDEEFRLKGKRKRISKEEILDLVENEPERFSANVLLRPICEDYLFPTGFYIGGPGEISYYAQAIPLYEFYGIQHPIVFPRASATIIEGNIAKILIKYNLSSQDFFKGSQNLKEMVVKSLSDVALDSLFDGTESSVQEIGKRLGNSLGNIDNNLVGLTENTINKILHQFEVLKGKSMKAQERNFDSAIRQITKAQNLIFPNDNLQERELTIVNFVNRYGFDFFDWLYNELEIREFKHQILEI